MTPLRIFRTRHGYALGDAFTGAPIRARPFPTRKAARTARALFYEARP